MIWIKDLSIKKKKIQPIFFQNDVTLHSSNGSSILNDYSQIYSILFRLVYPYCVSKYELAFDQLMHLSMLLESYILNIFWSNLFKLSFEISLMRVKRPYIKQEDLVNLIKCLLNPNFIWII